MLLLVVGIGPTTSRFEVWHAIHCVTQAGDVQHRIALVTFEQSVNCCTVYEYSKFLDLWS